MRPRLVVRNINPSLMIGNALDVSRSGSSTTHAAPSVFALSAVIWRSVEYRDVPQSPPGAGQSRAECFRPSSVDWTDTIAGNANSATIATRRDDRDITLTV